MPDITLLRVTGPYDLAAKRITLINGELGQLKLLPGKYFDCELRPVNGIHELSDLLLSLEKDRKTFIIRGVPAPGVPLKYIPKTLNPMANTSGGTDPAGFAADSKGLYWLMIDFDGIETPDTIDFLSDPGSAIAHLVSLLPAYFHDVSYHAHLTSTAGLDNGKTIRAHLWYWLANPVTDQELRIWAKQVNTPNKIIDSSMYRTVQIHLTSNPLFIGGVVDPFPEGRSYFAEGDKNEIVFPPIKLPISAYTPGIAFHDTDESPGQYFENALKRIGDHPGGNGFHNALLQAACCYVKEYHPLSDDDKISLMQQLRKTALQANMSKHVLAYVEGQTSDYSLTSMINWASAQVLKKGSKGLIFEVPYPHFPDKPSTDVKEVQAKLKEVTGSYFLEKKSTGVRASAGIGKTTEVVFSLVKDWFCSEKAVPTAEIYVPTKNLALELQQKLRFIPGTKNAFFPNLPGNYSPLEVHVIHGREYLNPKTKERYCLKHAAVQILIRNGHQVFQNLCFNQKTGDKCQYYGQCMYVKQYSGEWNVRIFQHASLSHERGFLDKDRPDHVVIDESYYQSMLVTNEKVTRKDIKDADLPEFLKQALLTAVDGDCSNLLADLRADEGVYDAIDSALSMLSGGATPSFIDSTDEKKLVSDAKAYPKRSKMRSLLEILRAELSTERASPHGVVTVNDCLELYRRASMTRFAAKGKQPAIPVLAIDADLDETIHELFFPDTVYQRISVPRNCTVVQITDSFFSKWKLKESPEATTLIPKIQAFMDEECSKRKMMIAASKQIVRAADSKDGPASGKELPPLVVSRGSKLATFGGLRGKDGWKTKAGAIIIGNNQPGNAVEKLARALWFDAEEPLQTLSPTEMWPRQVRGYRCANADLKLGVNVFIHPDARVQRLVEQVRESETTQAIDRLRLVHHQGEPKIIYVLSNLVLDLTVDLLIGHKRLLDGGGKLVAAWKQHQGVMPLEKGWLHTKHPDLFETEKIARDEIGGFVKMDQTSLGTYNRVFVHLDCRVFTYTLNGHPGKPRKCLSKFPIEQTRQKLEQLHDCSVKNIQEFPSALPETIT